MAWWTEVDPWRWPTFVGGAAMLALAAWVFAVGPGSRALRAFALFLVLRGALSVSLTIDDRVFSVSGRVFAYLAIALPFALLHLANQSWIGRGDAAVRSWLRSPWVSFALVFAAGVFEVLYFLDHDRFVFRDGPDSARTGPLGYFVDAIYPTYAFVAFVFAYAHATTPPGPRGRSMFDLALGFVLPPAFSCLFYFLVAFDVSRLDTRDAVVYLLLNGIGMAFVLGAVAVLFFLPRPASAPAADRASALRFAAGVGLAFATGILTFVLNERGGFRPFIFTFTTLGTVWHLALVGLVAYALVRHRFPELDLRVRWTMSRSVVGSLLVASAFVISEAAAQFLQTRAGENLGIRASVSPYVGIVGAGLLLFAFHPLSRFGDRVATAAMPEALPLEGRTLDERMAMYAEQVRIAWEDGALSAKERRLLDHVRRRLRLSDEQAGRLEREALAELHPQRRPVKGAPPHPAGAAEPARSASAKRPRSGARRA